MALQVCVIITDFFFLFIKHSFLFFLFVYSVTAATCNSFFKPMRMKWAKSGKSWCSGDDDENGVAYYVYLRILRFSDKKIQRLKFLCT